MGLLSNGKHKQKSVKIHTSKAVQKGANNSCKIWRISPSIKNFCADCLDLIFKRLDTREDRNSFGLTCRRWLYIQNNNRESLWWEDRNRSNSYPRISPESFSVVLCKLLNRFPHLKYLSLRQCPKIRDFIISKPQFFESKVQYLCLDDCSEYSNSELSTIFSWFPRLIDVSLGSTHITDKGIEALAKYCPSLEKVDLSHCQLITDSGISILLKTCRKVGSLNIDYCKSITGIGFLGCAQTLTNLDARWTRLKSEGIDAIVSGSRLEYLQLWTTYEFSKVRSIVNTGTVMTISKGCPLLRELRLQNCEEVELEGWEAIGRNCKNLERLTAYRCTKLCDIGLQALCNGCYKLSEFCVDVDDSCSSSALKLFERKKPGVIHHLDKLDGLFET